MSEIPQPRKFEDLNPIEKVSSMLSVIHEPTTRAYALFLAGIDYERLTQEQREGVDVLFSGEKLQRSMKDDREVFIATPELKADLARNVDLLDVEIKLTDILYAEWKRIKGSL